MTEREKLINLLSKYINCSFGDKDDKVTVEEIIALLKEHEKATIEPKRIDLPDETKAWLDKMDAVDALGNIADICMDWDGYRTANGLGGLINEIWAYARYCADRLLKAQEHIEARLHLCESCMKEYAECEADKTDLVYGSGVGNDNIIGCPWYVNRWKVQEPRVMTLEEIKALPDYVFLEDRDISHAFSIKTISRPALPQLVFVNISGEECVGFRGPDGDTSLVTSRYGVEWRCWTSRPTDEQREKVKWDAQEQRDYEAAVEMAEYCERYEPTYNADDGSM